MFTSCVLLWSVLQALVELIMKNAQVILLGCVDGVLYSSFVCSR